MLRGEVSNDDEAENLSGGAPANPFRPVAVSQSSIEQTVCCSGVFVIGGYYTLIIVEVIKRED